VGISLLEDLEENVPRLLRAGEIDTVLILTYTLNLRFFEQLVLPRLRRLGAVRVGILTDPTGYDATFEDPLGQDECGRSYVVESPPGSSPLLHAKALWLHGTLDIAYVGSHNLTKSGYNDQLEVTTRLMSSDPSHIHALRGLHQDLSRLVGTSAHLRAIWGRVPAPEPVDAEPSAYFFSSLDRNMLDQLAEAIQQAQTLRVVSPYLDADALGMLAGRLAAERIELIVPNEGTDTPLSEAVAAVPSLIVRRVSPKQRLHAKAYEFVTGQRSWLAAGSANCTKAGIARGARNNGNVEFLVLLPNGKLSEEGLQLENVANPSEMSGTGRNWDEGQRQRSTLRILSAIYRDGMLRVEWEADGSDQIAATLEVDACVYQCLASPIEIPLGNPPSSPIVHLDAHVQGRAASARSWVVFPEQLEAQVAGHHMRRWREYIGSDSPLSYGEGVNQYFSLLMRELLRVDGFDGQRARAVPGSPSRAKADAIEVFSFSNNPSEIDLSIGKLITGNAEIDPLAALRALIARLQGRPPLDVEQDEVKLNEYEGRRERGKRNVSEYLIQHLNRLAAPNVDWKNTQQERIVRCLRGTFEAVAIIWTRTVRGGASALLSRVAESTTNLLVALASEETARAACAETEVAGPLVLVVGSATESVDGEDLERLRRSAKALISGQPETMVSEWQERAAERAALLEPRQGERENSIQPLVRSAERLLGIADPLMRLRQGKWDLLCELRRADEICDPVAEQLRDRARQQYEGKGVWTGYETARAAGRLAPICRVTKPVCGMCHIGLPEVSRKKLQLGEAVLCTCGAILLFGSESR
jgi:hypothetical protein